MGRQPGNGHHGISHCGALAEAEAFYRSLAIKHTSYLIVNLSVVLLNDRLLG